MLSKLQERISSVFYAHGLFVSSHPVAIISLVITFALFLCYPLVNLPLPGNAPLRHRTALAGYQVPAPPSAKDSDKAEDHRPRWYFGRPVAYVQQIVVKATVDPWDYKQMIQTDAFRAPLHKAFEILEHINTFQHKDGTHTAELQDVCLEVSEVMRDKGVKGLTPEFGCLLVSPANFWRQDINRFQADGEIVKTVFQSTSQGIDSPPAIKDVLFGLPWKDTGVRRLYFRNRQRLISYALTIVYRDYSSGYVGALTDSLRQRYPLSLPANNSQAQPHMTHYHFKDINFVVEYTPLLLAYFVLFMYLYFSVRKIEMVKSKWGLALSAVMTVLASLVISVAICLFFGLTPSLNGSEIFPYLVVIIGLENILVVTKSVVSTPAHLEVKIRVAQGLSKEGWYIFKNLVTELVIVVVGFLTFVPAIQEFCMFALVGIWSDFFLQMFFFTTVLSVDIRRMELSDLQNQGLRSTDRHDDGSNGNKSPVATVCPVINHLSTTGYPTMGAYPPSPFLPPSGTMDVGQEHMMRELRPAVRTPRRVRLINFWASTRMVQRAIMGCVVVWILLVFYKSGLVDHLVTMNGTGTGHHDSGHPLSHSGAVGTLEKLVGMGLGREVPQTWAPDVEAEGDLLGRLDEDPLWGADGGDGHRLLLHRDPEPWTRLSHNHWPTLMGYYNMSLLGRYISVLPSVLLSLAIPPVDAIALRHPHETRMAAVLAQHPWAQRAASPQSRLELVLTGLLGLASLILGLYSMVVLYKCFCPRNYAKWRSSWPRGGVAGGGRGRGGRKGSTYFKQIRESVPLLLQGHAQAVDCVITDGALIVSSCLGGQIRVWDSASGECLGVVHRTRAGLHRDRLRPPPLDPHSPDCQADLYQHGDWATGWGPPDLPSPTGGRTAFPLDPPLASDVPKPRQRLRRQHARHKSADIAMEEFSPDLSDTINTNFSQTSGRRPEGWGYDQGPSSPAGRAHSGSSSSSSSGNSHSSSSGNSHRGPGDGGAVVQCHPQGLALTPETPGLPDVRGPEPAQGYDFSVFASHFASHWQQVERRKHFLNQQQQQQQMRAHLELEEELARKRSYSQGDHLNRLDEGDGDGGAVPAVWCMAARDNLIIVGCGNGRLEFWEGMTGQLKCLYHESSDPATALCLTGNRLICARLNGCVDFLELETFHNPNRSGSLTGGLAGGSARQLHRASSSGQLGGCGDTRSWDEELHCTLISTSRAHQQPINLLQCAGGRIVTASQDHTLKVFRLEDSLCLYTLHGHKGGVTALFLDRGAPLAAISGAEDGTVRVWDLMTGACAHKLRGHSDTVTCLTCTATYIVSTAMDDRLCIWERGKGELLHWIQMEPGLCNCIDMLTSNLMITGGQGCLYLWDISKGEVLRAVSLGDDQENCNFIHEVHVSGNSVVICDYGNELRVIHFPSVLEKTD